MHNFRINIASIIFCLLSFSPLLMKADGGLVAFYKVAVLHNTVDEAEGIIQKALTATKDARGNIQSPFIIVGKYHPEKSADKLVISFTRSDLIEITAKIGDFASLAAVLKVAVQKEKDESGKETGNVVVSLLNPEYLFYAYLRNNINSTNEAALAGISEDAKFALFNLPGVMFFPLITSSLSENELKNFRFMVRYPGFEDMVILKKFSVFQQAVSTTLNNLHARKNGTVQAYFLVPKDLPKLMGERSGELSRVLPAGSKTAVVGVGLVDDRIGEKKFLPILGEEHLAALPYEILIKDSEALMLNGRFRFPLFWSDVSMQELRQIYKTPRDIQETFKSLME